MLPSLSRLSAAVGARNEDERRLERGLRELEERPERAAPADPPRTPPRAPRAAEAPGTLPDAGGEAEPRSVPPFPADRSGEAPLAPAYFAPFTAESAEDLLAAQERFTNLLFHRGKAVFALPEGAGANGGALCEFPAQMACSNAGWWLSRPTSFGWPDLTSQVRSGAENQAFLLSFGERAPLSEWLPHKLAYGFPAANLPPDGLANLAPDGLAYRFSKCAHLANDFDDPVIACQQFVRKAVLEVSLSAHAAAKGAAPPLLAAWMVPAKLDPASLKMEALETFVPDTLYADSPERSLFDGVAFVRRGEGDADPWLPSPWRLDDQPAETGELAFVYRTFTVSSLLPKHVDQLENPAAAIASLAQRLAAAKLLHCDLHAGNLAADGEGELFALDVEPVRCKLVDWAPPAALAALNFAMMLDSTLLRGDDLEHREAARRLLPPLLREIAETPLGFTARALLHTRPADASPQPPDLSGFDVAQAKYAVARFANRQPQRPRPTGFEDVSYLSSVVAHVMLGDASRAADVRLADESTWSTL